MAEVSLKSCPFCGSSDEVRLERNYTRKYSGQWFVYVKCDYCGTQTKIFNTDKTPDDEDFWEDDACFRAIARWNKRDKEGSS